MSNIKHSHCRTGKSPSRTRQAGMATLFVSVIVLIVVTLVVVYAAKVGLMDLRMSGNEFRYKEAFSVADGGLEYAVQQFSENVTPVNGNYIYDPNGDGVDDFPADGLDPYLSNVNINGGAASSTDPRVSVSVTRTTSTGGIFVYAFTSTGESTDRTGMATVSQQIVIRHVIGGKSPDTPIVADGLIDIGGNMHVVPNPNGACPEGSDENGCPASVWTHEEFGSGSSISSCFIQGFENGQCPNPSQDPLYTQITNAADEGEDIIENDPYAPAGNFPPDLFAYLFGVPYSDWETIRAMAEGDRQVIDADTNDDDKYQDCDDLNANSKGIIWADVDCTINGNVDIGSVANPVILIIHNSQLSFGGHPTIYGIVFVFDDTPGNGVDDAEVDVGGGVEIRGSMMSNTSWGGGPGTGTFAVVYDPDVLNNIINNTGDEYSSVSSIPGSYRDF